MRKCRNTYCIMYTIIPTRHFHHMVLRCFSRGLNRGFLEYSLYQAVCQSYQRVYIMHRCRAHRHPTCMKTITLNCWIVQNVWKYWSNKGKMTTSKRLYLTTKLCNSKVFLKSNIGLCVTIPWGKLQNKLISCFQPYTVYAWSDHMIQQYLLRHHLQFLPCHWMSFMTPHSS